jgi:outer membrane lipoprotein SlyB
MTAGMIAGSTVGDGYGTGWAVFAGALLGSLLGAATEQAASEREGMEITVSLDGGERVVVVQETYEKFYAGDDVEVLTAPDGSSRVQHPKK